MSLSQLQNPSSTPLPRAVTRSGRWIESTDTETSFTSAHPPEPDLRSAAALLGAATRMHDSSDPATLLPLIAGEALDLVPADGVVLLSHDRTGPSPILTLGNPDSAADEATTARRCLRLREHHLLEPGQVADLDEHAGFLGSQGHPPDHSRWRSLLVADLDSAHYQHRRRLLWYSRTPAAFSTLAELGTLFAGQAGLALRSVTERHHLERAVEGRTVTGQATGILMGRYRITNARAFEILRRYSQDHNVKLREVADVVNRTGELPA